MRELKFRAWDEGLKRYFYDVAVYPNNIVAIQRHNIESMMLEAEYGATHWTELGENAVIEQYTGLKDKNGKEVYEGDIVQTLIRGVWTTGNSDAIFGEKMWKLVVFWADADCGFLFKVIGSKSQPNRVYDILDQHLGAFEVVGNIHENPELLEEEDLGEPSLIDITNDDELMERVLKKSAEMQEKVLENEEEE